MKDLDVNKLPNIMNSENPVSRLEDCVFFSSRSGPEKVAFAFGDDGRAAVNLIGYVLLHREDFLAATKTTMKTALRRIAKSRQAASEHAAS